MTRECSQGSWLPVVFSLLSSYLNAAAPANVADSQRSWLVLFLSALLFLEVLNSCAFSNLGLQGTDSLVYLKLQKSIAIFLTKTTPGVIEENCPPDAFIS